MSGGLRCPLCATTFPATARFCSEDGTPLVGAGEGVAAAAAAIPTPTTAARMTGSILDGRYRIERLLGEGGMSLVYLATDTLTGEHSAIKVLSPTLSHDRNAMARLKREAGLGGRLEHPNICHIVRLGETADGLVYIVMPYIAGQLLADVTQEAGQLPLEMVTGLVRDIAAGLECAHALGIVHRDLKPENVMVVAGPDGTRVAIVLDFGLAKERRAGHELEKLTATGIVLGTPEFLSPEQLRGKSLDGRTDLYALALMTFEMLTGKLPFGDGTQQEQMVARLQSDPTPLRRARPDLDLPAAVERVLLTGMARDPTDRYATVTEFSEAFAAAATGGGPDGGFMSKLFGR
ncbi:MAG: hypothetical protein NVS4B3_14600 [Gemmatimonadaceae bacterium]